MSYRDHLEAQKKYIQTKKEAILAKKERLENPQPQRLDPPPAGTSRITIPGLALLFLISFCSFAYLGQLLNSGQVSQEEPTIWIVGTEEEFANIKNWLEPEILANELNWNINHLDTRQNLISGLISGTTADLFLIEAELASEIYLANNLASIQNKDETDCWDNSFSPLWDPQPFRKTLGWAIPRAGRIGEARHLITVLNQFATPFNPE